MAVRPRPSGHDGRELFVAESTMKTYSRHIYRKIGVDNKQALRTFVNSYRA